MALVQHPSASKILYTTAQYLTESNIYLLLSLNGQERLSLGRSRSPLGNTAGLTLYDRLE